MVHQRVSQYSRWTFFYEIPITSLLIVLFEYAFWLLDERLFGKDNARLMLNYHVLLSFCLGLFALNVQQIFQDVHFVPVSLLVKFPILGIFSYSVYVIILGVGIVAYPFFAYAVRKSGAHMLTIKGRSPFVVQH